MLNAECGMKKGEIGNEGTRQPRRSVGETPTLQSPIPHSTFQIPVPPIPMQHSTFNIQNFPISAPFSIFNFPAPFEGGDRAIGQSGNRHRGLCCPLPEPSVAPNSQFNIPNSKFPTPFLNFQFPRGNPCTRRYSSVSSFDFVVRPSVDLR